MAVFFRYPQAGRPALSVQADHAQLPTSTVKLLTTVYIILHELGPESHQHTRILALSVNDGVWLFANGIHGMLGGRTQLVDGCGLSRKDRLSATDFAILVDHFTRSDDQIRGRMDAPVRRFALRMRFLRAAMAARVLNTVVRILSICGTCCATKYHYNQYNVYDTEKCLLLHTESTISLPYYMPLAQHPACFLSRC